MVKIPAAIGALMAAALVILGRPAVAGELKNYEDWVVGCDNWLDCQADSLPSATSGDPMGDDGNLWVVIGRKGDHLAKPVIELMVGDHNDAFSNSEIDSIREVVVDDGHTRIPIHFVDRKVMVSTSASSLLLAAMKEGQILAARNEEGIGIASASLRGLKAALLHIDAEQKRVGTVTALVKPGRLPFSSVPSLPLPKSIRVPPRSDKPPFVLNEKALVPLRVSDQCLSYSTNDQTTNAGRPTADFFRLDDASTLLILATTCGGYNTMSQIYIVDEQGKTRPARMHLSDQDFDGQADGLMGVWWDDKAGILSSFSRGRSYGDCGEEMQFSWDGAQFVLTLDREMNPCRGTFDFITTFRLNVAVSPAP